MRKHLLAAALMLAFASLGGCATIQSLLDAGKFATASISNPVTPTRLADAERVVTIAVAGLNAYKKSCVQGVADVNCRSNIVKIQAYTRRLPALLVQVRHFVAANDQVDAIVVFNQLKGLYDQFESAAISSGVKIGG